MIDASVFTGLGRRPHASMPVAIFVGSIALHVVILGWLAFAIVGEGRGFCCAPDYWPDTSILVELEPRPLLPGEIPRIRRTALPNAPGPAVSVAGSPTANPDVPLRSVAPVEIPSRPAPPIANSGSIAGPDTPPGSPVRADPWAHTPMTRDTVSDRTLRTSALACRTLAGSLTVEEQAVCDARFARAAMTARSIIGSGKPERDGRFAAEGAQAMAAYDQLHQPLKAGSRSRACPESPNPADPCEFGIRGRIWSSRDGWLPDLPGRH